MENSLYEILGVAPDATLKELKKAYRELSKMHHPDVGGDEEYFKFITEAYEILSDEEKRAVYDSTGRIPQSKERVEKQVISILKHLFDTAINSMVVNRSTLGFGGYVDMSPEKIIVVLKESISEKIKNTNKEIRDNEKIKDNLEAIKGAIKYKKDEKDNLYEELIREKILHRERNIIRLEQELEVAELVKERAKDYVYNRDFDRRSSTTSSRSLGSKKGPSLLTSIYEEMEEEEL